MLPSIILFVVIFLGLGVGLVNILGIKFNNYLEKILMSIGFGLGFFTVLTVTFNLIHIPLNWVTFSSLGLIGIFIEIVFIKKNKPQIKFDKYIIIVLLLFVLLFSIYLKGAFLYPYLEDDDSWVHVAGVSYVEQYSTYSKSPNNFFRTYIEPYPPSYDVLLGVLKQVSDNMIWTLKFFNVLLIALGIIFFYYFAKQFSGSELKAVWATFIITILPCFMSHFIWSQSLGLILIFPAFYCFEKIQENKMYIILGAVMCASIFLAQPSTAVFFTIMFGIYWLFKKEKVLIAVSAVCGVLLSLIYWIPTLLKYGYNNTMAGIGISTGLFNAGNVDTSGGIVYSLINYAISPLSNKIDQPIGIGIVIFIILLLTTIFLVINYKKLNVYTITILLWLLFTFIGTEGNALPFKLFPHRFWAFMCIPIALIVAEGIVIISRSIKNISIKYIVLSVVIIFMLWTSAYPKYIVQTAQWNVGGIWTSSDELSGYMALPQNLPKNTSIFSICSADGKVLSMDMYTPPLNNDLFWFRRNISNKSMEDIHNVVKQYNYDYVIVDGYCIKRINESKINNILTTMVNSTDYKLVGSTNAFWLFKVL